MPSGPVFELLTLGDELLLGLTANSHLVFIGGELSRRGVALARCVTLTDAADAIAAQFRTSWGRAQVVITTGGLGPTCDDRTREAVAEVLGAPLEYDEQVAAEIEDRFRRHGRTMTPNNLRQAWRPQGSEFLHNINGTAPGIWHEADGRVLVMLPGPPSELRPMFLSQVLPRLEKLGLLGEREAFLQLRTAGVGESLLETRLQPLLDALPGVGVAYCAHHGAVDLRLSPGAGGAPGWEAVEALARRCAEELGEDLYALGQDSLARVVLERLGARGRTLAVAESCTGGLFAGMLTDVPGASRAFLGGIVSYAAEAKSSLLGVPPDMVAQHGAVSAETAVAMALGAGERFGADYALSFTGYAGPEGGTAADPVGTVYIGLSAPQGAWARRVYFQGPREAVRERAILAALDWLRRELH